MDVPTLRIQGLLTQGQSVALCCLQYLYCSTTVLCEICLCCGWGAASAARAGLSLFILLVFTHSVMLSHMHLLDDAIKLVLLSHTLVCLQAAHAGSLCVRSKSSIVMSQLGVLSCIVTSPGLDSASLTWQSSSVCLCLLLHYKAGSCSGCCCVGFADTVRLCCCGKCVPLPGACRT